MLNTKSFLCFDFGAGSLKAAEFETTEGGTLLLKRFGIKSLGLEGSQETARENVLRKSIQDLLAASSFGSRRANVCAPGFHTFSKFVKLPPVDTSKVTQIIQYEAQQNVPFPLAEVVWDYQILGSTPTGELEVLLVAIKSDVVEGLFRTAEATGLKLQLVDVSPAALCNAFKFNYGDLDGCTMLLDIGAKTSNLLFFEKGKVYSRGINIGANSITQDFAAESKMRFAEAEKLKIAEGFVSLGGAYEEPDNPHQAAISKIARQVMTRLHIQVNQTIQFYRGQQGGSAPTRLFLAGGGSIMPYTSQFFAEKLNVPVEYFNPFRNVQIDPSVNLEELEKFAHGYGEVVGAGLRNLAQCPVELNLVPKSILKRQQFEQKKPYFIAALISLVLVVFAYGWFYDRVAKVKSQALTEKVEPQLTPLTTMEGQLKKHEAAIDTTKKQVDHLAGWLTKKTLWADVLTELRNILMAVEESFTSPGMQAGVWIEAFGTAAPASTEKAEDEAPKPYFMDPVLMRRYGLFRPGMMPGAPAAAEAPKADEPSTNRIAVHFKAMNLNRPNAASNNRRLISAVESAIQDSPYFDKEETKLSGTLGDDVAAINGEPFSFSMDILLKEYSKAKKGAKENSMTWVKRNLGLVISGVISLVLLGLAIYYLLRQKTTADEASTNLQGKTEELQRLVNRNPGASKENIATAKEDQKKIETFLAEMKQFFVAPAYPTGLHSRAFGVHLSDKIDELRHTAKASGVTLPTDFQFSFASQMKVPSIAPTAIEPLALQLAEIESICNVLFHAKINDLDAVRRSSVTADETAGIGDFLDAKPTTNEYTIISPYDVKFKAFSVDLANVLEGLIKATNCITVRDIVVQRTDAALTNEENSVSTPYQYPMQGMNSSASRYRGMSPDMMRRYGLRPPTPQVPTTPTGQPGARTTGVIQDEHQLSVTLSLLTVRNNLSGKVPKAAAPAAAPLDPAAAPDPNAPAQAGTQPATATE